MSTKRLSSLIALVKAFASGFVCTITSTKRATTYDQSSAPTMSSRMRSPRSV